MIYFSSYKNAKHAKMARDYLNKTFSVFEYAKLEYEFIPETEHEWWNGHCLMMSNSIQQYTKSLNEARNGWRDFLEGYIVGKAE